MTPKLYGTIVSPPVRAVMLCAKAIDLELDFVEVNLLKREQLNPEFAKINPVHTVPVLDDNGFIVTDSHAILGYLVENYAKDKSLYPTDLKKRTRINQMLFFDSGVLFARHLKNSLSVIYDGLKMLPDANIKAVTEAYGFLEEFLQNSKYVAGDNVSIADFSIITTVTNASAFVPLNENACPNIMSWKNTMESLPYYSVNRTGYEKYCGLINGLLSHN